MQDAVKKFNFDDMLHPQMRESMGEARPIEKSSKDANRVIMIVFILNITFTLLKWKFLKILNII